MLRWVPSHSSLFRTSPKYVRPYVRSLRAQGPAVVVQAQGALAPPAEQARPALERASDRGDLSPTFFCRNKTTSVHVSGRPTGRGARPRDNGRDASSRASKALVVPLVAELPLRPFRLFDPVDPLLRLLALLCVRLQRAEREQPALRLQRQQHPQRRVHQLRPLHPLHERPPLRGMVVAAMRVDVFHARAFRKT